MDKIIIRHLSGSKIDKVEEYPLSDFKELTFGRDDDLNVRYDPDKDDLVSRKHATIQRAEGDRFKITDEDSRNGTFVNKQKISGSFALAHGDVVQFGAGGPEFQFELDPPPKKATPPTRAASSFTQNKETRAASSSAGRDEASQQSKASTGASGSKSPGRVTVLQQGLETFKSQSRKTQQSIAAAFLGVVILLSGIFYFLNTKTASDTQKTIAKASDSQQSVMDGLSKKVDDIEKKAESVMPPKEIAKNNIDAVVQIRLDWKLTHLESNKQVYHYRRNGIPCYLEIDDGRSKTVIPWLTTDSENMTNNQAIGGSGHGTGFVVSRLGFMLTNRHVAAGESIYWNQFPNEPSYLFSTRDEGNESASYFFVDEASRDKVSGDKLIGILSNINWIPIETQILVKKVIINGQVKYAIDKRQDQYKSRSSLNVLFPSSDNPIPANLVSA